MNQMNSTLGAQAHATPLNSPRWVFKPHNIPRRPRQRVRITAETRRVWVKVNTLSFTILDEARAPIFRSNNCSIFLSRFTDGARHLYLLNRAVRWVRKNLPAVALTITAPLIETKVRTEAA
jgi:hypothetical protein